VRWGFSRMCSEEVAFTRLRCPLRSGFTMTPGPLSRKHTPLIHDSMSPGYFRVFIWQLCRALLAKRSVASEAAGIVCPSLVASPEALVSVVTFR
jgi:hypothetical protein